MNQVCIPSSTYPHHYYRGPCGNPDPREFFNSETNRIPLKTRRTSLDEWKSVFQSWPSEIKGWRNWYQRVTTSRASTLLNAQIDHSITLSLANIEKNEPILVAASYFWFDTLNAFLFNDGPMAPSLMDVFVLTFMNISTTHDPFTFQTNPKCL